MKLNLILIISTFFFASQFVDIAPTLSNSGACTAPPGGWWKQIIDPNKLGGRWFWILTGEIGYPTGIKRCTMDEYSPISSGLGVIDREIGLEGFPQTSYQRYMEVRANILEDTDPGTWTTNRADIDVTVNDPPYRSWILDIDYDSYYVAYYCSDDSSSGQYSSGVYVRSRGKTICAADWNKIYTAITNSGAMDSSTYFPIFDDQNNCPSTLTLESAGAN